MNIYISRNHNTTSTFFIMKDTTEKWFRLRRIFKWIWLVQSSNFFFTGRLWLKIVNMQTANTPWQNYGVAWWEFHIVMEV